ncbi:OLC1v1001626C1 [Oldenlandia corymbosa var. corymbosa]|uniref:Small ribosomal subunit protein cS22 n=1 Tax=Oldenlandia corymbosa var. corymbosa TaxID=529605 RepID=A0AAV1D5Q6_OLDCO|nr:OLC1v1001626C1 [Oldenlandia corymbosa var. corymbosa]
MNTMSSTLMFSPNPTNLLLQNPTSKFFAVPFPRSSFDSLKPLQTPHLKFNLCSSSTRLNVVAEGETASSVATADPSSEAARRLYVGNIPRTVTNDELKKIVEEHGAVEKAEVMYDKWTQRSRRFAFVTMKTVEDAEAAVEKLNGTQIGGREIKVNITEKPLQSVDFSALQAEEQFIDSPHKVYVGNLAKTVTTETLKNFFAEKGKVLSAKVSRVPGTSKSSGYGFVSFSSEEDVEAAISSLNNEVLDGQKIRVNKA